MRRLLFFCTVTLVALVIACTASKSVVNQSSQPNIILILTDDAGYVDFGFMGCKDLDTPRLDQLASEGVVFTDAHVSASVCAPSRAGLITGQYQQRFGHECNDIPRDSGLDLNVPTIASALKSYGYQTSVIGKWHLGVSEQYHPNSRGFDEFYGFLAGARSYFSTEPDDTPRSPKRMLNNKEHVQFDGYLTDRLGDAAIEHIDKFKANPFFMFLSFNAVHTPMHAKEEHLEKYRDHPRQVLAAMTYSMDENIGRVIDKLKEEDLYENTIIYFLSDNGGAANNQSAHGPLKGWKGNKFEAGHRIPYVVSWPKEIKGGWQFHGLTSSLDLFATSLSVASGGKSNYMTDGVNLIPYLKGEKTVAPHESLFWRKDEMAAARVGNQKLIRLDDYGSTLYDLSADLGESMDLAQTNSDKREELTAALENWEMDKSEPKWTEANNWNEVTYEIHQALMENREANYTNPNMMKRFISQSQTIDLFNGQNTNGWHIDIPDMDTIPDLRNPFIIRDGKLVSLGTPQGHLITNKQYENYRLEVKYRFAGEPGNCGVLVHASTPRSLYKMFPKSIEVQMYHENAGDFWCIVEDIKVLDMEARRGPPSEWGITEGKKRRILNLTDGTENPLGEWNVMTIECLDDKVKVWLNGEFINYGYESTAQSGQIAVQAEGAEVEFEYLRLTPIAKLTD